MDEDPSPFIFDGPVPPEEVLGRDRELAALRKRAQVGRFTLLYAPRRYGKTSLIGRLRADAERAGAMAVVIVDLEGCQTLEDLTRRIGDAYERLPRTRAGQLIRAGALALRAVQPTVTTPIGSVTLAGPPPATTILERLLRLPRDAAEKTRTRVLVVFDEFQAVAAIANADSVLRSQIQHQRQHVSYLFSGSERHLLLGIFSDHARPLYGQAEQLHLGPLPGDAAVAMVAGKFASTKRDPGAALALLVEAAQGHPQRLALLADSLWHATPPGATADESSWNLALTRALQATQAEFLALDAALSVAQRKVVRLLAWGQPPSGAAAARLDLAKSSAIKALETLVNRSIAFPRNPEGTSQLIDPLLAIWVRQRHARP
ncbi:MAG: AAA family ATPase [Candidatus Dormibacteria bacterium]